ncbi:xanthine dehydrogenase small subunit [Ornithinimicrobium tianjinense]|uniref:Dehydrogenase n=1 Tax=Ornithinimicrobium tianjinense TaxID=1195761 RepID=A0A917BQ04_9MICO|nr:FAD binding domain-containing protein [Ornithinimicrobium tianjinense]GGF52230.1 dehydrogenase [Ornithinimicrobium tianjinense]
MTTTSHDARQGQTEAAPGLTVNGSPVDLEADGLTPHTTLLDLLRSRGLTGAKEGCAEGECGACAVLVARPSDPGHSEWVALNACLVPAAALDGQEVVTAEGLGTPDQLHPVQQALADRGGSQCGYCTPGFVCAMAAEYYRPRPDPADGFDLHALSGNLCRCTGYRPIRDAAEALGRPAPADPLAERRATPAPGPRHTDLRAAGARLVRPTDLAEATGLLGEHPDAVVLAGSTDLGVEVTLRGARPPLVVAVDRLPELRALEIGDDQITVGAALTLTEVERGLAGRVPLLAELFPQFASRLIRNAATLGGNLGTASPIGDAAPVLLALDASLVLAGPAGERVVPLADYFTGYRTTVRAAGELIREVRVPRPLATTTAFHKIAKRRFDDISSVAVAFALDVVDGSVARARIGLGGVAATPVRALATERALEGMPWTRESVSAAARVLAGEGTPMSDHRASERYRRAMLEQSLLKLHATTSGEAR